MMTNLENGDKVEIFRAARVYRLSARQDWPLIMMMDMVIIIIAIIIKINAILDGCSTVVL